MWQRHLVLLFIMRIDCLETLALLHPLCLHLYLMQTQPGVCDIGLPFPELCSAISPLWTNIWRILSVVDQNQERMLLLFQQKKIYLNKLVWLNDCCPWLRQPMCLSASFSVLWDGTGVFCLLAIWPFLTWNSSSAYIHGFQLSEVWVEVESSWFSVDM